MKTNLFLLLSWTVFLLPSTEASPGDNSDVFQECLSLCKTDNCTADEQGLTKHERNQPLHLKLTQWNCEDECKYSCMWHIIETETNGTETAPKFYGKWPFVRYWGLQEPASTLFSLLTLLANVIMIRRYWTQVSSNAPFYRLWNTYFIVYAFGWLFSTVFHARDTATTEKLDYLGAFAMVLFSLYAFTVRITGPARSYIVKVLSLAFAAVYSYFAYNLLYKPMDYNYNVKMNVAVGALNVVGWLMWSLVVRRKRPYVWRCIVTMLLIAVTTVFVVADRRPYMDLIDSHALWHFSIMSLPFFWYQFIIDDSLALLLEQNKKV